ncbi:MAG: PTS sugar transporter subunit IIA [Terrimicrobiaceae bacterium]
MFLNLVQLAESFGVSEKVIDGWVRYEGLPHTPDRGRLLFDRAQVAQWAATRGLATKAGFLAPEAGTLGGGLHLEPLIRAGGIWRDVGPDGIFTAIGKIVGTLPGVTASVGKMLAGRLGAKGGMTIAPVGGGFALPHPSARIALGRESGIVAMILLREPLAFSEPQVDDVPVKTLLFFLAPSARTHLELLGRLSRLLAGGPLRELVGCGAGDEEIFRAVAGFDATGKIGGRS